MCAAVQQLAARQRLPLNSKAVRADRPLLRIRIVLAVAEQARNRALRDEAFRQRVREVDVL